jgi:hypothetical protein
MYIQVGLWQATEKSFCPIFSILVFHIGVPKNNKTLNYLSFIHAGAAAQNMTRARAPFTLWFSLIWAKFVPSVHHHSTVIGDLDMVHYQEPCLPFSKIYLSYGAIHLPYELPTFFWTLYTLVWISSVIHHMSQFRIYINLSTRHHGDTYLLPIIFFNKHSPTLGMHSKINLHIFYTCDTLSHMGYLHFLRKLTGPIVRNCPLLPNHKKSD